MMRRYLCAQFLGQLLEVFATDERLEAHRCACLLMGGARS
jgi:hypothetical protein